MRICCQNYLTVCVTLLIQNVFVKEEKSGQWVQSFPRKIDQFLFIHRAGWNTCVLGVFEASFSVLHWRFNHKVYYYSSFSDTYVLCLCRSTVIWGTILSKVHLFFLWNLLCIGCYAIILLVWPRWDQIVLYVAPELKWVWHPWYTVQ